MSTNHDDNRGASYHGELKQGLNSEALFINHHDEQDSLEAATLSTQSSQEDQKTILESGYDELPQSRENSEKVIRYAPFIPAWLDDLELNDAEYRLLCHMWRRGPQTCYPSGRLMSEHLKKNKDTVWRLLRQLENKGLIKRWKRKTGGVRNGNIYDLLIPTVKQVAKKELKTPQNAVVNYCNRGVKKVYKEKVPHFTNSEHVFSPKKGEITKERSGSNSEPSGTATCSPEAGAIPTLDTATSWAMELFRKFQHESTSPIGYMKEKDIVAIVTEWHQQLEITGGRLNGSPIAKPRLALERYLEKAALGQTRRCEELED